MKELNEEKERVEKEAKELEQSLNEKKEEAQKQIGHLD